jgi:hypothetical protein
MKRQIKIVLAVLGAVVVLSMAVLFIAGDGETEHSENIVGSQQSAKNRVGKGPAGKMSLRNKKADNKSGDKEAGRSHRRRIGKAALQQEDLEETEKNLTPQQREMLRSIEQTVDDDDKAALVRIVQELQRSKDWPDAMPKSIRLAAVEALEWFGSSCLPEAVGFLSDPDKEVAECALSQFEDAVEDTGKSDMDRARILAMAATVVTDPETMDSMLFELNNMRNSVAVDTIKHLWENGNAVARSLLPDAVESVTGEDDIDTVEKLDAWLKENPDDEDDEKFYGGSEDQ